MPKIIYPFAAIPNYIVRGGHGTTNITVLLAIISHGKCCTSNAKLADEIGCDRKSVVKAVNYWKETAPKVGFIFKVSRRYAQSNVIEIEFPEGLHDVMQVEVNGDSEELIKLSNKGSKILKELYEKQNGKCFYCQCEVLLPISGQFYSEDERNRWLEIEHMTPMARGGKDRPENIVGSCKQCNLKKGTMTADEFQSSQKRVNRQSSQKRDDKEPKNGTIIVPKTVHKEEPLKNNQEEDKITPLPPTGGIVAQPQGIIDQSYFDNPRQEIQIIGLYAQAKQCVFENIEQAQSFVRRNLLPARNLKGYRYERIHEVMNYLANNANFKWTLETVAKYIDEDLAKSNKNHIPTIQIEKLIRVEEL